MGNSFFHFGKSGNRFVLTRDILLFVFCVLMLKSKANSVEDSLICEIQHYRIVDSFERYYRCLELLDEHYVDIKTFDKISLANKYYDYNPDSGGDSLVLRQYLLYHAFYLKKYAGLIKESTDFYLFAHQMVVDKIKLDKNAWYI